MQALFYSTLTCYYNTTCVNLLRNPSNTNPVPVLSIEQNETRFGLPGVSTFNTLINHLFVEEFHRVIFLEKFLRQCNPQLCTYSLTHKVGFVQIISTILGLFGGMSIALKLFVGQIILRILRWRQQRALTYGTPVVDDANNTHQTGKYNNHELFHIVGKNPSDMLIV